MMEQLNSHETVLKQMEAYNFDDPIKVTLLFEEEEDDKLNETIEKIMEKSRRCVNTSNLERNHKTQTTSIKEANPTNNSHNTINKSSNTRSKKNPVTKNSQNNIPYIHDMNYIENYNNNRHPSQTQETFPSEDKTQSSYRYSNTYHPETVLTENKKNLLHLLDKVSYYLIEISQCYYYTFIQQNDGQTRRAREVQYFNLKHRLFDYSFYIADAILLPQHDNWNFIEKYAKRICALAYWKLYQSIPETFLLHLILDLINWTKQKKKNYADKTTNQSEIPTSTNNTLNQKKSNLCNMRRHDNKPTPDSICLFSYGPKNKEISITIQPNVLKEVLSPSNHLRKRRKTNDDISHVDNLQQTHKPDTTSSPTDQMNLMTQHIRQDEENISSTSNENLEANNQLSVLRPECSNSRMNSSSSSSHTTSKKSTLPTKMCKVCCTLTYKICLGCGREYYCSDMCQGKDWPSHRALCRT